MKCSSCESRRFHTAHFRALDLIRLLCFQYPVRCCRWFHHDHVNLLRGLWLLRTETVRRAERHAQKEHNMELSLSRRDRNQHPDLKTCLQIRVWGSSLNEGSTTRCVPLGWKTAAKCMFCTQKAIPHLRFRAGRTSASVKVATVRNS
jgi:hypothetical protein